MTRRTDLRTTRMPVLASELPTFTPVPRQCNRHDGWTEQRQRDFIEALADTGSVHAACKAVNMSQPGAYQLRRQPGAETFRAAWQAALDLGVQVVEDVAMERALHGIEVPVISHGKRYGSRRIYNDRLLMFILRNRAPERFAEGGGAKGLNAVGKMELERKKKEWREEWEAERSKVAAEARASYTRKFDAFRKSHEEKEAAKEACLTEETRQAFAHAEALKARDLARAGLGPDQKASTEEPKALPPVPTREPEREEEPEVETGTRIRRLKDEGWA
ncbi:hypothetical protein [Pontixanthobacter sp. CEM42]|uniref:hypothetical protein n=1 Tax=Pontixanthobacter sp. CEM42 TaxID=2792077 RepID=UPI001AE0A5B4|nr:hypothetical protein [Pontixanthobacter sp. CEM42]